jgi:hypothetical protein
MERTATELRKIERSLAYSMASGIIESECLCVQMGEEDCEWRDLNSANTPLEDEVAYLESRRLIERHPEHREWVTICDEGEPLPSPSTDEERAVCANCGKIEFDHFGFLRYCTLGGSRMVFTRALSTRPPAHPLGTYKISKD